MYIIPTHSINLVFPNILEAFVESNATMTINTIFRKSCDVFCVKPKEVDPNNLGFCRTNKCSIALDYVINNGVLK